MIGGLLSNQVEKYSCKLFIASWILDGYVSTYWVSVTGTGVWSSPQPLEWGSARASTVSFVIHYRRVHLPPVDERVDFS